MHHASIICRESYTLLLLKSSDRGLSEGALSDSEIDFEPEESYILCRNCFNIITALECMISVNGGHKHTFSNPAGMIFDIGCFSAADGCLIVGEPTSDFTWFDGYRWSHVICSNCLLHMGWAYDSGSLMFFGLILKNLLATDITL